jgi:hypothetical protein
MNENHHVKSCKDNLKILHTCNKGNKMNVLESFEIYKAFKHSPNDVLNEKLNFGSNILFDRIVKLQNKRGDKQLIPLPQGQRHQVGIG